MSKPESLMQIKAREYANEQSNVERDRTMMRLAFVAGYGFALRALGTELVEPKAKRIALTTDWGYEDFAVCSVCSAVVGDVALHMKSHSPSQPVPAPVEAPCVDCRDYEGNIREWIEKLGGDATCTHISRELERLIDKIASLPTPAPDVERLPDEYVIRMSRQEYPQHLQNPKAVRRMALELLAYRKVIS